MGIHKHAKRRQEKRAKKLQARVDRLLEPARELLGWDFQRREDRPVLCARVDRAENCLHQQAKGKRGWLASLREALAQADGEEAHSPRETKKDLTVKRHDLAMLIQWLSKQWFDMWDCEMTLRQEGGNKRFRQNLLILMRGNSELRTSLREDLIGRQHD